MIEVILNDRLGKKIRVKCNEDDTIGDLKKLVAAQTGGVLVLTSVDQEMLFAKGDVRGSCVYKRGDAVAEDGRGRG